MIFRAESNYTLVLTIIVWMIGCAPPPPQPITLPNAVASKDSVIVEPVVPQEIISVISDTVEIMNFDKDTLTIGEAVKSVIIETVAPVAKEIIEPTIVIKIIPQLNTSNDGSQITFILPAEISAEHLQFIDESLNDISEKAIQHILNDSIQDDSLSHLINHIIVKDYESNIPSYEFVSADISGDSLIIRYQLNRPFIVRIIKPYLDAYGYPGLKSLVPLFTKNHQPPTLETVADLSLILPCEGISIPTRALLLPNAPRSYRHGIHRGIDFYVNWGSPVRAAAGGIVVRADHHYKELPAEFRKKLLAEAKRLGHTPSDVFEHALVGQAIYIDHGFDLVPGYRSYSIYAHLSHINTEIMPGTVVNAGDLIGLSGNSGTEPSTLGTRKGAHLHWELILQDAGGEYYLGQGFNSKDLYSQLLKIFSK